MDLCDLDAGVVAEYLGDAGYIVEPEPETDDEAARIAKKVAGKRGLYAFIPASTSTDEVGFVLALMRSIAEDHGMYALSFTPLDVKSIKVDITYEQAQEFLKANRERIERILDNALYEFDQLVRERA
ncbi:MAG: hypothetical protein QXE52_08045 [Candidatus Caldarchaeum sp.]